MRERVLRLIDRAFGITRPQAPVLLPPDTALLKLDGFAPPGFTDGLEILNDDSTPMEFVVAMLNIHVGLSYRNAVRTMLEIHHRGGALLPTTSASEAQRIATAIGMASEQEKHLFVCRPVSIVN